jgi:hypothetical protein
MEIQKPERKGRKGREGVLSISEALAPFAHTFAPFAVCFPDSHLR